MGEHALRGYEFLILLTVKGPDIASLFNYCYFFCRKDSSLLYSMLVLSEPFEQVCRRLLGTAQA